MKFAIGGQLNKTEIKELITKRGYEADIFTDTDASMKVKNKEYDYYVGACQSGAGGALAMAYAVLGREHCGTIAMAGIKPSNEKVERFLDKGVVAFGFTNDQADNAVTVLLDSLESRGE
ncbi:MAG: DUF2620 domain-containing protein [Breznakia sp.]